MITKSIKIAIYYNLSMTLKVVHVMVWSRIIIH